MTWQHLKDLKESHPIEVAEYAIANKLVSEPVFEWWVPSVMRRTGSNTESVKSRMVKRTHKFGIRIPRTVEEALKLDRQSETRLRHDAIVKEMTAIRIAFDIKAKGSPEPLGFQYIDCHMIFDVKMDFTRKARFVAGGHMTEPPASLTYASVERKRKDCISDCGIK
jgi:hypothetical protein